MSPSSKLVLLTTVLVMAAVAVEGFMLLGQREEILQTATRNETLARAQIMQAAIESQNLNDRTSLPEFLNTLRKNSEGDTVAVLDESGAPVSISGESSLATNFVRDTELKTVIGQDRPTQISRQNYVFTVLPMKLGPDRRGMLAVIHPLASLQSQIRYARRSLIIATMLVTLATFVIVLLVTNRYLTQPLENILAGTEAFGSGDLDFRVVAPHGRGALFRLTMAFNRMADRLARQRDEAEQKAEEQLALERQLRQNERLAMVGRLAASIAHEIGAPLNVIDGRAEQLIMQPNAALERRQRNLTIIRAQTKRIERIVRQLLTFVRPFEATRQAVELHSLITEVMELVGPDAKNSNVKFDISGVKNFSVFADPELIRQVFLNLSMNAIQAMPGGGTLRIISEPDAVKKNGDLFTSVQFADTGEGIPPEQINYVFEPFFTTKRVSEGTGLGLAICQRIVEKHGGWIYVTNDPNGGASFTIYLPSSERRAEKAAPEDAIVTTEL